jgi:hypothetical protein
MSIYDLPLTDAKFTVFCGGNGGDSDDESCIEAAAIPGTEGAYALRTNTPGSAGKEIRATTQELRQFVTGIAPELGLSVS